MRYISTRGRAPALDFDDVLLTGLARDGGLYVPEHWPHIDADMLRAMRGLSYAELTVRVLHPFMESIAEADLGAMAEAAYATFDDPDVAPLRQLDRGYLMELFHGPTLAFKDLAMQLLSRLFDHVLQRRGQRVTIVGATSGDTGAAAIAACRDRPAIDVFILFPKGRVSSVQQRQMTTVTSANVHAIAVDGNFDDCQALVKAMFNDHGFRDAINMTAVNSINWARVAAQIVYFVRAAAELEAGRRPLSFCVPTGNFGCVFSGYAARAMGVPIERLIVATNRNDILHRFFQSGRYAVEGVVATQSPSMDIQVASNFERLLFDLAGRDGAATDALMQNLSRSGHFSVPKEWMDKARACFASARVDEDTTTRTIAEMEREAGLLIDPHTAVALRAAKEAGGGENLVTLSTAHPAKFPEAVERAVGHRPPLPASLADLFERPERMTELPNDLAVVQDFVRNHARPAA